MCWQDSGGHTQILAPDLLQQTETPFHTRMHTPTNSVTSSFPSFPVRICFLCSSCWSMEAISDSAGWLELASFKLRPAFCSELRLCRTVYTTPAIVCLTISIFELHSQRRQRGWGDGGGYHKLYSVLKISHIPRSSSLLIEFAPSLRFHQLCISRDQNDLTLSPTGWRV